MNFFANFSRINTIFISKTAVKSRKLCVKTSFWYIPEIIAGILNKQGGKGSKISLRNRGREHIDNVTGRYKGQREGQIFAKNSVT